MMTIGGRFTDMPEALSHKIHGYKYILQRGLVD